MEQQIGYCTTSDGVRIAYGTYRNKSLQETKGVGEPVRLYAARGSV